MSKDRIDNFFDNLLDCFTGSTDKKSWEEETEKETARGRNQTKSEIKKTLEKEEKDPL